MRSLEQSSVEGGLKSPLPLGEGGWNGHSIRLGAPMRRTKSGSPCSARGRRCRAAADEGARDRKPADFPPHPAFGHLLPRGEKGGSPRFLGAPNLVPNSIALRAILFRQEKDAWPRRLRIVLLGFCLAFLADPAWSQEETPDDIGNTVVVTGASQEDFPKIAVQFEVRRFDGSFLRDATKEEFRVFEDGKEMSILDFQAPTTTERVPTTIVLVVDRSLSMSIEDRMPSLKEAVATFLEKLPEGSRVAVIAFGSEVTPIQSFTADLRRARESVDRLRPAGATRFYDAVSHALELLDNQRGRRVVLALTDGEDNASVEADLDSVAAAAVRLGLPVFTLGLGPEEEVASVDLRRLADSTRGQYYPARRASELKAIYETIAERIGAGYSLTYQSDRRLPDGTLRPVQIFYRGAVKAGETTVFIPGMVVPAAGWSPLFLGLSAVLIALARAPALLRRRADGDASRD